MTEDIDIRIKMIFCEELGLANQDVDDSTAYDSTDAWDSLKHLQMVTRFEEEFDIELPVDDVIDMSTFRKVKEILKGKIHEKGEA